MEDKGFFNPAPNEMVDHDRHVYQLGPDLRIDKGIQQLWTLPPGVQIEIIAMSMRRWDENASPENSLHNLGIDYSADVLVEPINPHGGGPMHKGNVIVGVLFDNIEFYPWETIKRLGEDSMDFGTWDGIDGKPGKYFEHKERLALGAINPSHNTLARDIWKGPKKIRRAESWIRNEEDDGDYSTILGGTDPNAGVIVMRPQRQYLVGMSPAVKLDGVQVHLATRSGPARWGINGAVNSDTVHNHHVGPLVAEASVAAEHSVIFSTDSDHWVMYFYYAPRAPKIFRSDGAGEFIHTGKQDRTLKEAVDEFVEHPEVMLPAPIRANRRIILSE